MNEQPQQPPQNQTEELTLTPADERALDHAWSTITEEDIAASIHWLNSLPPQSQRPKTPPDDAA